MSFYAQYSAPVQATNPSIGSNGSPIPSQATLVGAKDPSTNLQPLQIDSSGNLLVSLAGEGTSVPVVQPDTQQNGNITTTQSVTLNFSSGFGYSTVGIGVTGSWTGTILIEASNDGTNFTATTARQLSTQDIVSTITSNGLYQANLAGFSTFRVRGSTVSGNASIHLRASVGTGAINNQLPTGSNTIGAVNQAGSSPWIQNITQFAGSNVVLAQPGIPQVGIVGNGANVLDSAVGTPIGQAITIQGNSSSVPVPVNNQAIPQSGATNALSLADSTVLEASHVIKASSGRLYQLTGVNTKASAQYIQVFNSTTVPSDGTTPILLAYVPSGSVFSFDFSPFGRYFSTGICVTNSSTAATKTIGSADCWFNAGYL